MVQIKDYTSFDAKGYAEEIVKERTIMDMMEDPEVGDVPLEKRAEAAKRWYDARLRILGRQESDDVENLRRFRDSGLVDPNVADSAIPKVREAYKTVRESARKKYEQVVTSVPAESSAIVIK